MLQQHSDNSAPWRPQRLPVPESALPKQFYPSDSQSTLFKEYLDKS